MKIYCFLNWMNGKFLVEMDLFLLNELFVKLPKIIVLPDDCLHKKLPVNRMPQLTPREISEKLPKRLFV